MCMQRKALGNDCWAAKTNAVDFCNTEDVHELRVNAPLLAANICPNGLAAAGVAVEIETCAVVFTIDLTSICSSNNQIATQFYKMKLSPTRH